MRTTSRLVITALAVALVLAVAAVTAGAAGAASGSFVWKKVLNPTANADGLWLGARGPSASYYACGTKGWPGTTRIWLVKYRANGTRAWSRSWTGPDASADDATGLAVDAAGNAYVAGRTRRTDGDWDSVVLKYDAGGHLDWGVTYAAVPGTNDARTIGLDASGNVFVAGVAYRSGDWDVYTARFRPSDGVRQWTSWYDGSAHDMGWTMAVTATGDCYVGGQTDNAGHPWEALLVKTTAAGDFAWAKVWGPGGDSNDLWATVTLARSDGVVVAGATDDSDDSDVVVARYLADGTRAWVRTWTSSGGYADRARAAAVARDGSVWVTAVTERGGDSHRSALLKYDASGARRFVRALGTAAKPVELRGLALDGRGNAFSAGAVQAAGGGTDPLAVKYSSGGALRWRASVAFPGKTDDGLDTVVLGGSGYLYGCGTVGWSTANAKGLVVKIRR